MITGVRGTGKAVFLTKLAKEFDNNKNWIVVDLKNTLKIKYYLIKMYSDKYFI